MKKPILVAVVLTASVMLNLFFVAGYVYNRYQVSQLEHSPEQRMKVLARRIGLEPRQLDDMKQAQIRLRQQGRRLNQVQREQLERLWQLLEDPATQPEQRDEVLHALAENELDYRRKLFQEMQQYLTRLEPQQREKLLRALKRRNLFRVTGAGRKTGKDLVSTQGKP